MNMKEFYLSELDKLVKEKVVRKGTLAYEAALQAINNPGELVVCGSPVSSGKWSSSKSWRLQSAVILSKIGVPFEASNVSPKGGKAGDRIKAIIHN